MMIEIIRHPESQACWFPAFNGYVVLFYLYLGKEVSFAFIFWWCAIISRAELLFESQAEIQKQCSQANLNKLIGCNFIAKIGM